MKTLKTVLLIVLSTTIFFSCDNDNDPTNNVCEDAYVNDLIIATFLPSDYDNLPEYMDLKTNKYQMQINANGEICSVGYQNPSTFTGDYTIEIINNTSSASYTGTHTFSQAQLEYQPITPVPVASGDLITVMRTVVGTTTLAENTGRILRKADFSAVPFPITAGNIVFLNSDFYGAGGPLPNFALPVIPVGFKVN